MASGLFRFLVPYHQPLEVSKMKSLTSLILVLTVLLTCAPLRAEPVIHKFEIWGKTPKIEKVDLYFGWTNGFLQSRGSHALELVTALIACHTNKRLL